MFMNFPVLRLKFLYSPVPAFVIAPYGQYTWGFKYYRIYDEEYVYLNEACGGVDLWYRVAPQKKVTFKIGAGVFAGYDNLSFSGGKGNVALKGLEYGATILAGIDIITKRVTINLDFGLPIGMYSFATRTGEFRTTNPYTKRWDISSAYPTGSSLVGFEFKPGITINF
jgi:hypothetical protein